MIIVPGLKNKKTAVYGLGATGVATAQALIASGAQVFTWDENSEARKKSANTAYHATHPKEWPWAELQFVVISPGIPLTYPEPHAIIRMALKAKVKMLGDLELFAWGVNALPEEERPKIIAITGSNGKSTTTSLIQHILDEVNMPSQMGGNIGLPVMAMKPFEKDSVYVLELSSFQLDLVHSLRADIAILLNLSPDHLDRHGTMKHYIVAKERIFRNQTKDQFAIIGVDDEYSQIVCAKMSGQNRSKVLPISVEGALGHGVYTLDGRLFYNFGELSGEAGAIDRSPTLRGKHNWQNASAALAAVASLGVSPSVATKAMERFSGLTHRMESVATISNVEFINDSKATNAEATAHALRYYKNIYWIVGGRSKDGGLSSLLDNLSNIKCAYLIGDASDEFGLQLEGSVPVVQCGNLAAAVSQASRDAIESPESDAVVLLSPACASYDQFKNFEDRGDTFKRLVLDIVDPEKAETNTTQESVPPTYNGAAA